jgi:hypothetical protein
LIDQYFLVLLLRSRGGLGEVLEYQRSLIQVMSLLAWSALEMRLQLLVEGLVWRLLVLSYLLLELAQPRLQKGRAAVFF